MKSLSSEFAAQLRDEFERSYEKIIERACNRVSAMFSAHTLQASVYWPSQWSKGDGIGGKAPDDPLTFYVSLPFYEGDEERPYWSFSLKKTANEFIELHEHSDSGCLDDAAKNKAIKMAGALRALAETLEHAAMR